PFSLLKEYRRVFSYHKVKEQPKLLLVMTGLSYTEFHQLLPHFQYAWDQYVTQHYVDRADCSHLGSGGGILPTMASPRWPVNRGASLPAGVLTVPRSDSRYHSCSSLPRLPVWTMMLLPYPSDTDSTGARGLYHREDRHALSRDRWHRFYWSLCRACFARS